jgi:hypothetical protein
MCKIDYEEMLTYLDSSFSAKLLTGRATRDEIREAYGTADVETKRCIASSEVTPPDILTVLAKDEDFDVRYYVARNSSTPADVLTILAKDEDFMIRYYVAYNASVPSDVLIALAKDSDSRVRCYVACKNSTPLGSARLTSEKGD